MTAACNSRRGMVKSLKGATRDIAATNRAPNLPLASFHLAYTHAPNAHREASQKTTKVGFPFASQGVRHRGKRTLLRAVIPSNRFIHFLFTSADTWSSQPSPSCHNFCSAIFGFTRTAAPAPIESIACSGLGVSSNLPE